MTDFQLSEVIARGLEERGVERTLRSLAQACRWCANAIRMNGDGRAQTTAELTKRLQLEDVAREVDEIADRVARVARTGRIGDGKIFALPTAWPVIEF